MEIFVDTAGAELRDPTNFAAFKVVLNGDGADDSIAGVGRWLDEGHVAISIDALRTLAGPHAGDPQWEDGLAKMLAYAGSKGWIVDESAIRAHVERTA
jgi:hypothetical protein